MRYTNHTSENVWQMMGSATDGLLSLTLAIGSCSVFDSVPDAAVLTHDGKPFFGPSKAKIYFDR